MFKVSTPVSRVLFVIAFVLLAAAVWEKIFNLVGASMVPTSRPIHLMISAGVLMLFVIALQLHEIKDMMDWQNGKRALTDGQSFKRQGLGEADLPGARPAPSESKEDVSGARTKRGRGIA